MAAFNGERDTLPGFLRDLDTRLTRQERRVHRTAPMARQRTVNARTGALYTPDDSDRDNIVTLAHPSTITVTLPADATVPIPHGVEVDFIWLGNGRPIFVAGSGATVESPRPNPRARTRFSRVTALKLGNNLWLLSGDLA
jgi:hypothetical protein